MPFYIELTSDFGDVIWADVGVSVTVAKTRTICQELGKLQGLDWAVCGGASGGHQWVQRLLQEMFSERLGHSR